MKTKYKDYLMYYTDLCRLYVFYIHLIRVKLIDKDPLTRKEEDLLSMLIDNIQYIEDLEGESLL